jgi:hypothetical protein
MATERDPAVLRAAAAPLAKGYIRLGDERRIPMLLDLLERYGSMEMANSFLNCGKAELIAAAKEWAQSRRLCIVTLPGGSSPRWGR